MSLWGNDSQPALKGGGINAETTDDRSRYDLATTLWEKRLLGPGDWQGHTSRLVRGTDGEIAIPGPDEAEAYVRSLNEIEKYLLRARAVRVCRYAFWFQLPLWIALLWVILWLGVAYPLVHFGVL